MARQRDDLGSPRSGEHDLGIASAGQIGGDREPEARLNAAEGSDLYFAELAAAIAVQRDVDALAEQDIRQSVLVGIDERHLERVHAAERAA